MLDSLFHFSDLGVVGLLVVLEGLLSADNALVLAVIVQHLPKAQHKKALLYGLVGAMAFRLLGILGARWIMELWYLRAAGGLYLLYLCIRHFIHYRRQMIHEPEARTLRQAGFWKTVMIVELTDVAFAIDSILVAVAVSNKLWVVWTGGFLGIVAMRLVANFFIRLIEQYPDLIHSAYLLVGWVSVKLLAQSYDSFREVVLQQPVAVPFLPKWLFWVGMALIIGTGIFSAQRHRVKKHS